MPVKNLAGRVFGKLKVLERAPLNTPGGQARWLVYCDPALGGCGSDAKVVTGTSLTAGATKSCGCGIGTFKHGHARNVAGNSPEYNSWENMIQRCTNQNRKEFAWYGERGITVCNRWRYGADGKSGFECFLIDLGPRPKGTTIDRYPHKTGNYEPTNCRWATRKEQQNNTRRNVNIIINGRTQTRSQWEQEFGWKKGYLRDRSRALAHALARLLAR
jgi:hypothetical protein